ncbi:CYFA0S18e02146g1_1 [Cyberlindnera fabianii]|uniref:CYFA0S18e02146g1_1 n=1 Tax=Cyberlindnera fabianii TaxID=36022 RepID=A0A061BEV0_CYBFA|nr:Pleckstrin y domain-containing family M member 1 [Cyberlindnera fabianii]CDR45474.1 CYFA0S18e02146g1_1 [Cyberlindnera fabianii]
MQEHQWPQEPRAYVKTLPSGDRVQILIPTVRINDNKTTIHNATAFEKTTDLTFKRFLERYLTQIGTEDNQPLVNDNSVSKIKEESTPTRRAKLDASKTKQLEQVEPPSTTLPRPKIATKETIVSSTATPIAQPPAHQVSLDQQTPSRKRPLTLEEEERSNGVIFISQRFKKGARVKKEKSDRKIPATNGNPQQHDPTPPAIEVAPLQVSREASSNSSSITTSNGPSPPDPVTSIVSTSNTAQTSNAHLQDTHQNGQLESQEQSQGQTQGQASAPSVETRVPIQQTLSNSQTVDQYPITQATDRPSATAVTTTTNTTHQPNETPRMTPNSSSRAGLIVRLSDPIYECQLPLSRKTFMRPQRPLLYTPVTSEEDISKLVGNLALYLVSTDSVYETLNSHSFRQLLCFIPMIQQLKIDDFSLMKSHITRTAQWVLTTQYTHNFCAPNVSQIHMIIHPTDKGDYLIARTTDVMSFKEYVICFLPTTPAVRIKERVDHLMKNFAEFATRYRFIRKVTSLTVEDATFWSQVSSRRYQIAKDFSVELELGILQMFEMAIGIILAGCNVPCMLGGEHSMIDALVNAQPNNYPSLLGLYQDVRKIVITITSSTQVLQKYNQLKAQMDLASGKASRHIDFIAKLPETPHNDQIVNVLTVALDNSSIIMKIWGSIDSRGQKTFWSQVKTWRNFFAGVIDIHWLMTTNEALVPSLYQVQVMDFIINRCKSMEILLRGCREDQSFISETFTRTYKLLRPDPLYVVSSLVMKRTIFNFPYEPAIASAVKLCGEHFRSQGWPYAEFDRLVGQNKMQTVPLPFTKEFKESFPFLTRLLIQNVNLSPSIMARKKFLMIGPTQLDFDTKQLCSKDISNVAILRSYHNPDVLVFGNPDHVVWKYACLSAPNSHVPTPIPASVNTSNSQKDPPASAPTNSNPSATSNGDGVDIIEVLSEEE